MSISDLPAYGPGAIRAIDNAATEKGDIPGLAQMMRAAQAARTS